MNTFAIDIPSLYEYTSPQKSLLLFELSTFNFQLSTLIPPSFNFQLLTFNFPKEFPCIP